MEFLGVLLGVVVAVLIFAGLAVWLYGYPAWTALVASVRAQDERIAHVERRKTAISEVVTAPRIPTYAGRIRFNEDMPAKENNA